MLSFDYPWPGLEDYLAVHHGGRLPLFAYGSLLNAASAVRTMPGWRRDECRPANAFGVVRVFNYPLTADAIGRYGAGPSPRHVAALGVRVTGHATDRINGLVYALAAEDLHGFRQRETDYRLIGIPVTPWGDGAVGVFPTQAFVLEYPGPSDPELLPHPGYLNVCREGAASFGERFRDDFDHTTLLADGRRLSEYL